MRGDSTRPVATRTNARGIPTATTRASPAENKTRAQVEVPPRNVIPIIFVPGIMGSNLKATRDLKLSRGGVAKTLVQAGAPVWRIDSSAAFAGAWLGADAAKRQILINKDNLEVDFGGKLGAIEALVQANRRELDQQEDLPPELTAVLRRSIDNMAERVAVRRHRGWGSVAWQFYGSFLEWLESQFGDQAFIGGTASAGFSDIVERLARPLPGVVKTPGALKRDAAKRLLLFQYPVYACGYNWAASNLDSGAKLAAEITRIIGNHHGKGGQVCEQVILITHSMGGLVARAAAMESGAKDQILGIIHGVMPTHGAAAMYKRAALGFGGEATGWGFEWVAGVAAGYALGNTAAETTPVLAYNPGPLELAPNQRYNEGRPWLFIKDGRGNILKALPERGDPYSEIYGRTDTWWGAIHENFLNPAQLPIAPQIARAKFLDTLAKAKSYHYGMADNGYHPHTYSHYGADISKPAWGRLAWKAVSSEMYVPPLDPSGGAIWPQRVTSPSEPLRGNVDQWQIEYHQGPHGPILRDDAGSEISATVDGKSEAGDGTVPAAASASGVDRHSIVVVRHETGGYAHDASYNDDRVRYVVVDAIVRMVQYAKAI